MIAKLKGKIDKKIPNALILDTGPIAYKVFVPAPILANVNELDEIVLWIHQVVREDELSLFGFCTFEELTMFELLLSISGVGPKMALGVLSRASLSQIEEAVSRADLSLFTKVPGIGKKNAARIILELKSKLEKGKELDLRKLQEQSLDPDALSALTNLGFKSSQAREVLSEIDSKLSTEDKIRAALKLLH